MIFISHSHSDGLIANRLHHLFEQRFDGNVTIFNTSKEPVVFPDKENEVSEEDTSLGSEIEQKYPPDTESDSVPGIYISDEDLYGRELPIIEGVIDKASVIVVILTKSSASSDWVRKEGRDDIFEPDRGIPILGLTLASEIESNIEKFSSGNVPGGDICKKDPGSTFFSFKESVGVPGEDTTSDAGSPTSYYFVDRKGGLKDFFSALEQIIDCTPLDEIDWSQESKWLTVAMQKSIQRGDT